eukprot:gene2814-2044_t
MSEEFLRNRMYAYAANSNLRQVSKIFTDANEAAKVAEEALSILQVEDDRVVENRLVSLLDYDNFDLVKLFVTNKHKIFYATKLKRAQSEAEKKALEAELSHSAIGKLLLEELEGKTSAQEFAKRDRTVRGLQDDFLVRGKGAMDVDEEDGPSGDSTAALLAGLPKLRLEDLSFQGSNHFMANERCELPEKSWRVQKKGYEEIHVPALKAPVVSTEQLKAIRDLPSWMHPCFGGVQHLNRVQSKLCDYALSEEGGNMLLCAPTGSGKTNVALLCMLGMISRFRNADDGSVKLSEFKIVYVAPMKALVHECVQNFSKRLEPLNITVKELSGDQSLTAAEIAATQIIVTTPEKWDVITRKAGDRAYLQFVRLMIVDEIHLLHDERGAVLESIIGRTIRTCEETKDQVRMVGLSATLPNYEDVAAFMRVDPKEGLFYFDNSFRPVPLQQQFIGITEKKSLKKVALMNEICYEKALLHAGRNQMLIFTHSRADTMKTARALVEMCQANDTLSKFVREGSASSEILRAEAPNAKHPELQELLKYGFAFHHAGLTRSDRTLVEDLFADKHVQVLVSTATLAWGVNLPVHTVIIKGTQVYSPEQGRWTELSALDILQMMGRAGRYGLDSEGEGIIMTQHSELQYYLSLMNQQLPIESHLIKRLPESLNAEIVLGTISTLKDAVEWLGYSYLYVRMIRNPRLYQVSVDAVHDDPYLFQRRMALCYAAVSQLEKRGMVQFNRTTGNVVSNYVGKVASYYYVTHETMDTYVKQLRPSMQDIELFRLLSQSAEFSNMFVRPEEKLELNKLIQRVPVPIKESVEEPACKINVLLQAYISKLKLEGFALSADMTFIQQSAARLFRCLFELAWKKKWASVAVKLLELAIMVDRKLWRSQSPLRQFTAIPDSPLRQFTAIPDVLIRKLERISDIPWSRYVDLTPQDLGEMVKLPKMGKTLHKFVHMLPRVHIDLRAYPLSRSLLRLDIACTPDFEHSEAVHGRSVVFWVMVEDGDGQTLLHIEPMTLFFSHKGAASATTHVSCTVPLVTPLPPQYFLRVMADRWLHAHQVIPISFQHLLLPEKFPVPTAVLDLKPVTTAQLSDGRVRGFVEAGDLSETPDGAAGISTLNSLQTQTFHALHETDAPVLVCAPAGSGKQLCLELALTRYLSQFYSAEAPLPRKVVYLCPHQDWCTAVARTWALKGQTFFPAADEGSRVVLLSGDALMDYEAMKQADVVVSTPENWALVSLKWKQRKAIQQVGLYLLDHVQLIASGGALGGDVSASTYEMVISRARFMATTVFQQLAEDDDDDGDADARRWKFPARFVSCGYATANAKDVGDWLGVSAAQQFYFTPQQSPGTVALAVTPSEHHDQNVRMSSVAKHMFSSIGAVYRAAAANGGATPRAMVFVPMRKQARLLAIDLVSYLNNRRLAATTHQRGDERKVQLPAELAQRVASAAVVQDRALREVLQFGVGYIYEGQSSGEQQLVMELYTRGLIGVLFVPFRMSTAVHGVHVPQVYVLDTQYFEGQLGVEAEVDAAELLHMVGRARHCQFRGHVQVYCPAAKRDQVERVLTQLLPIESRIHTQVGDHLLAEMVSRTIETKTDSVDFLTWTFLYRRLAKNPNFYGLLGTSVRHISDYLSELVEESLSELQETHFVAVEDNELDVSPLNLGMIASYYGLSSDTIAIVANSLTAKSRIKAMVEVLSCAVEWEAAVPLRQPAEEWPLLAALARQVADAAGDKQGPQLLQRLLGQRDASHAGAEADQSLSDMARKVMIVWYSYQRRLSLSYELRYDLNQFLRGVQKLLHATVDVLSSQGWLKTTLAAMELHQCVIQGVSESDSSLLQLPHVTRETAQTWKEAHGVESIVDFVQLEDDNVRSALLQSLSPTQVSDIA